MKVLVLALLIATAVVFPSSSSAQAKLPLPNAGSMTWGQWRFDFEVGDENEEGLVLKNVRWKNVKVLHKASVPVIRVKYRGNGSSIGSGCGPWMDQIDWGNIELTTGATTKVFHRIWGDNLEVAVYAEIGGYYLWQSYIFRAGNDPVLYAKLFSAGWSCGESGNKKDHKHHPYWRLDFDVAGVNNDVFQLNNFSGNPNQIAVGRFDVEGSSVRESDHPQMWWMIYSEAGDRNVRVEVLQNERRDPSGSPWFSFSKYDASVRRYKSDEDEDWDFGAKGNLGYANPAESLSGKRDIVFWAIGHLSHNWTLADQNDPHWHDRTVSIRPNW
jgi:hypothetical protein